MFRAKASSSEGQTWHICGDTHTRSVPTGFQIDFFGTFECTYRRGRAIVTTPRLVERTYWTKFGIRPAFEWTGK